MHQTTHIFANLCQAALLLSMVASCAKPKPQLPSNRPESDSAAIALVQVNQRLAQDADEELTNYATQHADAHFVHHDMGFWYRIVQNSKSALVSDTATVEVHYQVFALDQTAYEDALLTAQLGKKQLPTAIECAARQMHLGEIVELLAPWYLMYGRQGNGQVPAYANVRVLVELSDD